MWTPTPLLASFRSTVRPEDVPPPTPVELPSSVSIPNRGQDSSPLSPYLQSIHRPIDLEARHLAALGLHVNADATIEQLIPNPAFVPDFAAWEALTPDEIREKNDTTRLPLCVTNRSPGCQTYLDRKKEFSYQNPDAFRTVRRLPHPTGVEAPKLGGSYDFWRCLEALTAFWDDPTNPPKAKSPGAVSEADGSKSPTALAEEDGGLWRSSNGEAIPPTCLQNLAGALIKLVAYEFGCSVAPARVEPRLSIISHPETPSSPRRCSSIPSSCTFVFRSATSRVNARAGIVDGPLAAVSVRHNLAFKTDFDSIIDLAREVVAALLTAQQRARDGKTEKRFGEGEWWTTKPRWGGGPGGSIGREVDKYDVVGDKDDSLGAEGKEGQAQQPQQPQQPQPPQPSPPVPPGPFGRRANTKSRKTMTAYDNYRIVRPPSTTWDPKTRYGTIGKTKGADYDDIYVINILVHHVSIVRFRIPDKLLDVLDGGADDGPGTWNGLEAWRSPWLDVFVAEERITALRILWAIMGYMMRADESEKGDSDEKKDIDMTNT